MKHVFTLILFVIAASTSIGQTLEQKTKELADASAALATAQAKVDAIKAEVAALTPPVIWKKGGFAAVNFNSLGLTNWAAGGVESNSITALGNIFRNYSKDKIEWNNSLDLAYGLIQNKGQAIRKNEDKIDFLSQVGVKATEKLSYAALLNFKSQFAEGFDFSDPNIADSARPVISKFLAPASILASVGFNYKVTDYLSVYLSPATGKFTIVNDTAIANQWIYIPEVEDPDNLGTNFYDPGFRSEFGALLSATLNKDLTKKMNLRSTLNVFDNFTDINRSNRKNIDVDWQTMLNMKLTEYIGASLFTHVLYDNDTKIALYDESGNPTGTGQRIQFKRLLGVGFSYKF